MIRWLVSRLYGPLCMFGTANGTGCLRPARWRSPWGTPLLWCNKHRLEHHEPLHRIDRKAGWPRA